MNWELDPKIKEGLIQEAYDLLREYGHMVEKKGIEKAIDEWAVNKKPFIQLLQNHPNWDQEKFQIRFDTDYSLQKDPNIIRWFFDMWDEKYNYLENILVENEYDGHKYSEWDNRYRSLRAIVDSIEYMTRHSAGTTEFENPFCKEIPVYIKGKSLSDIISDKNTAYAYIADNDRFTNESVSLYQGYKGVVHRFRDYKSDIVSEDLANYVNTIFPKLRASEGMKMSRLVNKFFTKIFHVDKIEDKKRTVRMRGGRFIEGVETYRPYNAEFAKYADAINQIKVKRHTIISVNPIDYLTMAFGNSWATCMTIDRRNKRKRGDEVFRGLSCGGTLSYMMDGVTAVVYTVDSKYEGHNFELEDKINRNLIHYKDGIMIQGRLYPQSNDNGANDLYEQFRNIEEKVIADCLGFPNLWKYERGTETNSKYCRNANGSAHFADYFRFEQTGTCRLKMGDHYAGDRNREKIEIGHTGIDLRTGEEYTNPESLLDERHIVDEEGCVICADCGRRISVDEAREIDGLYYCGECSAYCEYHQRYEPFSRGLIFVPGYGNVCPEGKDYMVAKGTLNYCDHHGDWVYGEDQGRKYNNEWWCNRCAEREHLIYDRRQNVWRKRGAA